MQLENTPLVCYIDALDECCEDEVRDMVDFFEDLGESAFGKNISLHVCFASRHYPHITVAKGLQLTLEGQDGHNADIKQYINKKLKGNGPEIIRIRNELEQRASGIFLWVVLVIPMLRKASDSGRTQTMRQRRQQIPDDLSTLFTSIVSVDTSVREELCLTFQWIMFAQRPLRPEELYHAVHMMTEPDALKEMDPTDLTSEGLAKFVLDCSRGLAELTRGKRPVVHFIHESIREYLRNTGMKLLDSRMEANMDGRCHERLNRCCARYIAQDWVLGLLVRALSGTSQERRNALPKASSQEAQEWRSSIAQRAPFLGYALYGMLFHADSSAAYGISRRDFMRLFRWDIFVYFVNILQEYDVRRYRCLDVDHMYIYANEGMQNLLQEELEDREHFDVIADEERYKTVLGAAAAQGSVDMVRALLEQGADELQDHEKSNILVLAAQKRSTDILNLLLVSGLHDGLDDFCAWDNRILKFSQILGLSQLRTKSL